MEQFNFPDSDISLLSCDNVRFNVHRKILHAYSNVFAGAEGLSYSDGEIVELTETGAVFELLLKYMYHQPTNLQLVDFALLYGLADAAEKYQVETVAEICQLRMRDGIPTHPFWVLNYATKHRHVSLMDAAARSAIGKDITQLQRVAPLRADLLSAWIQYENEWRSALGFIHNRYGLQAPHKQKGGDPCEAWLMAYAQVLRNLGGDIKSLLSLDAVFDGPIGLLSSECNTCMNSVIKWRNEANSRVDRICYYNQFLQ